MGKMINCREYRGRDKNGKWHHGSLVMAGLSRDEPYIVPYANWGDDGDFSETVAHKVEPETVGQFTGVRDENRKKRIFEGDIVEWQIDANVTHVGRVVYEVQGFNLQSGTYGAKGLSICWHYSWGKSHIIGNIFDNPELLEVK